MKKKNLKNISLIAVTSGEESESIEALNYSSREINFHKKILFSDKFSNSKIKGINFINIPRLNNISEWGKFIVFDLYKFIESDFIILIHPDGFIVNPSSWTDDFLKYDFIGAPWKIPRDNYSCRDIYGNIIRVGNSVSIRSKKLLALPSKLKIKWDNFDHGYPHEDGFLNVQHRHLLQEKGINFPTLDIACKFGREATIPENKNIDPFTFHKWSGKNKHFPCFNKKKRMKKFFFKINKGLKKFLNV